MNTHSDLDLAEFVKEHIGWLQIIVNDPIWRLIEVS